MLLRECGCMLEVEEERSERTPLAEVGQEQLRTRAARAAHEQRAQRVEPLSGAAAEAARTDLRHKMAGEARVQRPATLRPAERSACGKASWLEAWR